jgi:hypothetical protein
MKFWHWSRGPNEPMISPTLVRAALRLSPRMFAYHVKRAVRNRVVRGLPWLYRAYISKQVKALPYLKITGRENIALARKVAAFYTPEYRHATEDAARGAFSLFGERLDFGAPENINWHATIPMEDDFHLWRMKLGHMGFICPMLIDRKPDQLEAVSRMITAYQATAQYDEPGAFTSYLFPYSVSHRILAILSGFLIAQSEGELPASLVQQLQDFLRWNAGFVLGNIEHELKNNHVERNLAALCLYLDAVDNVPTQLARSIDRDVAEILHACILPDGLLAERSAMYQGLTVMALMIFAEARILSQVTRDLAQARLSRATRAWAVMTHPDGEIGLFNDSWWGEVPPIDHVMTPPSLAPLEALEDAGYARLAGDQIFALFDAGPIGPRWNPGHGHGDFLSAEIDIRGQRFIVDPGTYQYSTGPRRHFERAAQSHNGPCWTDVAPVEYQGCFKVGRIAEAQLFLGGNDGELRVRGLLPLAEGSLSRIVTLAEPELRIEDNWSARPKTAQVTLIIQGEWTHEGSSDHSLVFSREGQSASISVQIGEVANIHAGEWARRYLQSEPATVVVLKPIADTIGRSAKLVWSVRAHPP